MLQINMFSTADKVKGQGVGSAYDELIAMLNAHFSNEFDIRINDWISSDISHYHTINPTFYISTFFKKRGRKIGYVHFLPETLEGSLKMPWLIRKFFYRYVIAFYKRMDHIVVVNPMFIDKLAKYGIDRDKITYIPNFVSKDEFYPANQSQQSMLKQQFGYSSDDFIVLGTGQVQTRKGILDFAKLARKNPTIQFIWAGGFSFGQITDGYKELKQIVDNPPQNLSFPGIVDRKKLVDFYNMCDLFLLPSFNELFPMSVLEAFSCGKPVLLRNLDLYKVIIEGYYQSFDDFNQLNDQLHRLINDPKLLVQMGKKSIEASNYYSEDHLAKIWHSFYIEQAKKG
ncbi:glycosyltransferase family 4 protein [Nicoliella spurrieriana]|uniref:Glycosyltransferase family 4 protein n=1 Tax=Nicoliella spurrieriana TaxID=2925830 RepID=A0A976X5C4_9LACO|nr:glycosyltransferase family 4 protein [Nicoliella spurrieriana]UQS86417.1 glycosyltransferase family 4 protein [Nicoliella spurrieriana]